MSQRKPNTDEVAKLLDDADRRTILLLYGARDEQHNQAVALNEWFEKHASKLNQPTK